MTKRRFSLFIAASFVPIFLLHDIRPHLSLYAGDFGVVCNATADPLANTLAFERAASAMKFKGAETLILPKGTECPVKPYSWLLKFITGTP
jgi:hypothetical protein